MFFLRLLWLVCLIPLIAADVFPPGVVPLVKFGNKDYFFAYKFRVNFFHAEQICTDLNMKLVTIPNRDVNDFIFRTISSANQGTDFWTSGSNVLDAKTWVWMSTAEPVVYTNWQRGQPTQGTPRCILAQGVKGRDLFWSNIDCNTINNFICESVLPGSPVKVEPGSWANLLADPSVSPNFPIFTYNKKSYVVVNNFPLNFLDSDRFCRSMGMNLVTIESEAENTWLYKYLRNLNIGTGFWTGGTRLINGVQWVWLPSGKKVLYTNWRSGQPDNFDKNEYCIQLVLLKDEGLVWNDLSCPSTLAFICEAPTEVITKCPVVDPGCYDKKGSTDVIPDPRKAPTKPVYTYKILTSTYTYADAVKACEAESMKLASIQDQEKNIEITKVLHAGNQGSVYISATENQATKTWYWITGELVTFTNWNVGEPNNAGGNENCIQLFKSGTESRWNDVPCDAKLVPLCEKLVVPEPDPCCCKAPIVNVFYDKAVY